MLDGDFSYWIDGGELKQCNLASTAGCRPLQSCLHFSRKWKGFGRLGLPMSIRFFSFAVRLRDRERKRATEFAPTPLMEGNMSIAY